MLRHADVAVTSAPYVENKQRAVLGLVISSRAKGRKDQRTIIPVGDEVARYAQ